MESEYIKSKNFKDYCDNQDKLIGILNHRMTKIEVHVGWLRKLVTWQLGLMAAIFVALMGSIYFS